MCECACTVCACVSKESLVLSIPNRRYFTYGFRIIDNFGISKPHFESYDLDELKTHLGRNDAENDLCTLARRQAISVVQV